MSASRSNERRDLLIAGRSGSPLVPDRARRAPGRIALPTSVKANEHAGRSRIVEPMLEGFYLVVLIGAFLLIALMSVFIVYKLFAGQE